MAFDLDRAESFLEDLFEQHQEHLDVARGFGMRTAAIPKGIMSVKEAQNIVASFEKDATQLSKFLDGLGGSGKVLPGLEEEFKAISTKAHKMMAKFEADRKAAVAALDKYEDLLVGEHFQEAFEAIRHALLDFDLSDNADMDFTTKLHLNDDPSWGSGKISLLVGGKVVLIASIGYQAEKDYYWGDITIAITNKTYPKVVEKTGHTFLPRFVREFTGQVKALADDKALGIFTSKKKVDLKLVDVDGTWLTLIGRLAAVVRTGFAKNMVELGINRGYKANPQGTEFISGTSIQEVRWPSHVSETQARDRVRDLEMMRVALAQGVVLDQVPISGRSKWMATFTNDSTAPWTYSVFQGSKQVYFTENEITEKWPPEWKDKIQGIPMEALRKRALELGVNPAPFGAKKLELAAQLRKVSPMPTYFTAHRRILGLKVTLMGAPGKTADEKFADLYRTAGGEDFFDLIWHPDPKRAFTEAQENAGYSKGRGGYSGTIVEKSGFRIRVNEPMSPTQAQEYANKDIDSNDKYDPAFAVPVSKEKVLKKEMVTVTVEARDEIDARKRGALKIKATGRIPPNATILVDIKSVKGQPGPGKTKTYEVSGERRASVVGEINGWLFYGVASS